MREARKFRYFKIFLNLKENINEKNMNEKIFEFSKKPRLCPVCKSKRIASILYGYPAFTEELIKKMDEGKITLGGCCVSPVNPTWQCADCGAEFHRKLDFGIE